MRPVCLQLKGFTSFKDETTVPFAQLDRFVVCGPTGAGKSSLFDAITFALFASAPRIDSGTKRDLISLGRKSFSVTLDFRVDSRVYRVTRSRSHSGNDPSDQLHEVGKIEPLATGAQNVSKRIEGLLGLSYVHFTQAVFLPQGKFAEFLQAPPAARRRLLNELLRLLVYERMRESAGQQRTDHAARKEQTERRLREDFTGVSAESREEIAAQLAAQNQIIADADRELPGLQLHWEQMRCGLEWCIELAAKQIERTKLEQNRANIDGLQREVDIASRAAGLVPLLDQAQSARVAAQKRQQALTAALQAVEQHKARHTVAKTAHARATKDGGTLPGLRERIHRLVETQGKVKVRDQLQAQLETHEEARQEMLADRARDAETLARLAAAGEAQELSLAEAMATIASIGFDEEHQHRLEAVREDALRLRSDRERLAETRDQLERAEGQAGQADKILEDNLAKETAARQARDQAQQRVKEAEQLLREAEDEHSAAHLRAGLKAGQPCPVCHRKVTTAPKVSPVPELEKSQWKVAETQLFLVNAERILTQHAEFVIAVRASTAAAQQHVASSRAEFARRGKAVELLEQTLQRAVGGLLNKPAHLRVDPGTPTGLRGTHADSRVRVPELDVAAAPRSTRSRKKSVAKTQPTALASTEKNGAEHPPDSIEEVILAALRESAEMQTRHRQALHSANDLRNSLNLLRKDRQAAEADVARLDAELVVITSRLAEDRESLDRIVAEIIAAVGASDPAQEAKRVQLDIERIEKALADAQKVEAEANKQRVIAESSLESCRREATTDDERAVRTETTASEALRQAGFPDPQAARAAFRNADQLANLKTKITEHAGMVRGIDSRIAELEKNLNGRRVSREECRQAEQAHLDLSQRRRDAQTQAVLLAEHLQNMEERLERARQLREEQVQQERSQQIYDQLARDLRSDNFQAFLLEETLAGLVRDASLQLMRLTGDRYGLHFEDERIFVIDNDNAAERRGVETLSGGETFLASLALALALSEQVQKIAGAVHLDCLFIDEGFGALDPETLRTVSDTIRALQVGGRMVGVITHVPELKEEFDQRLLVDKKDGSSHVVLEIA